MNNRLTFYLATLILFSACQLKKDLPPPTANGVWQQLGYGKIFEIENDSVRIYDVCKVGCQLSEKVLLNEEGVIESFSSDTLKLRKNIKTYRFTKLAQLPDFCKTLEEQQSPIHNFEVLWNTFNEQYCYFEKRKVDWKKTYEIYRNKISDKTNNVELFLIFKEMLESINDGHVSLDTPESLEDTLTTIHQQKATKEKKIKPKVHKFQLGDLIAKKYCKNYKSHNAGIAKWGMMKNEIGYIQINAMWLLAYYDLPKNIALEEFYPLYGEIMETRTFQRQDEIDGADKLMDTIAIDLQNAKAIILDFRFNQGGKDEVGLEIIGQFVNKPIKFATKKARLGDGFTNHQEINVIPNKPTLDKKVYLLTSHISASAAEVATMATLQNDQIIKIGAATEGIFSDGLDKRLPNGWTYTLSNEIYEDAAGNDYEGIGIPPDINLNYPKDNGALVNLIFEQLNNGGDEAIEMVFELEKG